MNNGYIHQTVGLEHPDEELDLDYVQGHGVEMELEYALSNSLGFGGHNASILIKKYADELKSEVMADSITLGEMTGYTKEWNINGEDVVLGVAKVTK